MEKIKGIKKAVSYCKNCQNFITIYYNVLKNCLYLYEFTNINSYIILDPDEWVKLGTYSKNHPIYKIPTMAELKKEIEKKLKEIKKN